MKTKTLLILLIVLALLAGAGALILNQGTQKSSKSVLGASLFEELPVNEITSIKVEGPENTVVLSKKLDRWVVESRYDYPADFSKITDFVRKLKNVTIGREFESSEETIARLALKAPGNPEEPKEEKGTQVFLNDKNGNLLAKVTLGKARKSGDERGRPNAQYVMLEGDSKIYLIDEHFSSTEWVSPTWLEKNLTDISLIKIKKISCLAENGEKVRFALNKEKEEDELELVTPVTKTKVKKSAITKLTRALMSLQLEDVTDPQKSPESLGMNMETYLEYRLFDGKIFRVYPGGVCEGEKKCYLKIAVDYEEPPPAPEDKDAKPKEEGAGAVQGKQDTQKPPEEVALDAKLLNERLSKWTYVLSKWKHEAFVMDIEKLLEKPEQKKPKKE